MLKLCINTGYEWKLQLENICSEECLVPIASLNKSLSVCTHEKGTYEETIYDKRLGN